MIIIDELHFVSCIIVSKSIFFIFRGLCAVIISTIYSSATMIASDCICTFVVATPSHSLTSCVLLNVIIIMFSVFGVGMEWEQIKMKAVMAITY